MSSFDNMALELQDILFIKLFVIGCVMKYDSHVKISLCSIHSAKIILNKDYQDNFKSKRTATSSGCGK